MNSTQDLSDSIWLANTVFKIVTSVVAICGIPGNVVVLALIGKGFLKRKPFEWLLFNLALVDLVQCINSLFLQVPFIGHYFSTQCHAAAFIQYLVGFQSFLVPPIIAYSRYLSLYDPHSCEQTFTHCKTAIMCISTWFASAALFLPFAVTGDLGEDDFGLCGLRRKMGGRQLWWPPAYVALLITARVVIGICYIALFLCSYKIISRLRNHTSRASPSIQSRLMDESRELVTLTSLIFVIPFLTQSPAATAKTALLFAPDTFVLSPWVSRALITPFALPAAVDPYMTLYIVKEYRRKIASCMKPRSENL